MRTSTLTFLAAACGVLLAGAVLLLPWAGPWFATASRGVPEPLLMWARRGPDGTARGLHGEAVMGLGLGAAALLVALLLVRARAGDAKPRRTAVVRVMAGLATVAFAVCVFLTTSDAVRHAPPVLVGGRVEALGYAFGVAVTFEVAGLVWSWIVVRRVERRVEASTTSMDAERLPAVLCAALGGLTALAMRLLPWRETITGAPDSAWRPSPAPGLLTLAVLLATNLPLWAMGARGRPPRVAALPAMVLPAVLFGFWAVDPSGFSNTTWSSGSDFVGSAHVYGGVVAIALVTAAGLFALGACVPRPEELDEHLRIARAWAAATSLSAAVGFLVMYLPWEALVARGGEDLQLLREKYQSLEDPQQWGLERAIAGLSLHGTGQAWFALFGTFGSAFGAWFSVLLFHRLGSTSRVDPRIRGFCAWFCSTVAAICILVKYVGFRPEWEGPPGYGAMRLAYGSHVALVSTLGAAAFSFLAFRGARRVWRIERSAVPVTGSG